MKHSDVHAVFSEYKICVLIPAYNCEKTIDKVLNSVLEYTTNVIVVNDGSTDQTLEKLNKFERQITIISYLKNKGKGYALRLGFDKIVDLGFDYALTMDSDGQHLAEDMSSFAQAIPLYPNAALIGSRSFDHPNMPQENIFANKFSNFWFQIQTFKKLPDTQTGFRLYPLKRMKHMRPTSNRYEAELEMLVRLAWRAVPLVPITIRVYYPPKEERISHFRPKQDFFRISILNTLLCLLAIVYGYPSMLIRFLKYVKK